MKLNPDCVRGILLTIEEKCDFSTSWYYSKNELESKYLTKYSHEEIIYHIGQCDKSGLIDGVAYYDGGDSILIGDLSPYGHEFLANIRTETVWKKLSKLSSASLPVLFDLAKDFALAYYQQN